RSMAWTIRQMDDFAGLAGMGMAQPWWYSSIRCSVWGHSGPARGSSRCSHRAGCRRDLVPRAPWQIGHTAGAISAAPQEVAVAAQLQGWMLAWGIWGARQIISEHF